VSTSFAADHEPEQHERATLADERGTVEAMRDRRVAVRLKR
jgi:hypothetical protein